jgi:hypothetical protein
MKLGTHLASLLDSFGARDEVASVDYAAFALKAADVITGGYSQNTAASPLGDYALPGSTRAKLVAWEHAQTKYLLRPAAVRLLLVFHRESIPRSCHCSRKVLRSIDCSGCGAGRHSSACRR